MYCPTCGDLQPDQSIHCSSCDSPLPVVAPPPTPDLADEVGLLIPVRVEPVCMLSGYLGLFGFFFAGLPGIFAILTGVLGLRNLKKEPRLKGVSRAWTGIVLGILQCLMLCWFAFMAVT